MHVSETVQCRYQRFCAVHVSETVQCMYQRLCSECIRDSVQCMYQRLCSVCIKDSVQCMYQRLCSVCIRDSVLLLSLLLHFPPRWPSGKASTPRAADLMSIYAFSMDLFPGRVIPVT